MRIKRGLAKHKKHVKVLKAVKGFRQSYSKLYRRAKEALLHAGQYSFAHRRARRAQFRKDWIKIIGAGLSSTGISYSKFFHNLQQKQVEVDRKILAEIAQVDPEGFQQIVSFTS
jgi:large subunit ribosomal protein L20